MKLLDRIEIYLKETHMSPTRFGRRAVGDPRFVLDLRAGRRPRFRTLQKVERYLGDYEAGKVVTNAGMTRKCSKREK